MAHVEATAAQGFPITYKELMDCCNERESVTSQDQREEEEGWIQGDGGVDRR